MPKRQHGGRAVPAKKARTNDEPVEERDEDEEVVQEALPRKQATNSSIDLFSEPVIDVTTKRCSYESFTQSQTTMNPVIIRVPRSQQYIDLSNTTFSFDVNFEDSAGVKLQSTAQVAPVNNIGHSLIRTFKVTCNGNDVNSISENNYHELAYISRLYEYGPQEKANNLTIEGWYDDTPGKFDELNPTPRYAAADQLGGANAPATGAGVTNAEITTFVTRLVLGTAKPEHNEGAYKRHQLCCQNRAVHFEIYPQIPFFKTKRLLPPGCELIFTIYWNPPEVVFNSVQDQGTAENRAPKFSIVPNSPRINIKNVMLSESNHVALEKHMLSDAAIAKYPHMSTRMKTAVISNGLREYTWNDIFNGQRPSYLFIGLKRGDALTGSYSHSFTNYQDMGQSSMRVTLNGEELPYPRIKLDQQYKEAGFKTLLKFSGQGIDSAPVGITRENYKDGYYILSYNLNPDGETNYTHDYDKVVGTVSVQIEFSRDTANNTTVVAIGYFENQGWMDGNKNYTVKRGNL